MATATLTMTEPSNGNLDFPQSDFNFGSTMSPEDMFQGTPSLADSDEILENKPSKKRRSWGQQLPAPTTNLPPRKRAKTEAEKEQRRIERVIRNRLAAHSSRERKRKEVESLEDQKDVVEAENAKLRSQLVIYASKNAALLQQIKQLKAELGRPIDDVEVKEEELPLSPPHSPRDKEIYSSMLPESSSLANPTDMTQHPAEML
ncbi:MAG: hypothetical protein GOMPHAMPRED_002679 [Gomphillus americanus]|uniref:BZIP domain-containing protein n=1 Tax=Gomphillus americanus TaxID=1940652 RepID=A0A8H3FCK8_9LECA|nr:MAG: hypothetical protein GOMPHAMPRED_002679 [Gomphillus americanus]